MPHMTCTLKQITPLQQTIQLGTTQNTNDKLHKARFNHGLHQLKNEILLSGMPICQ